MEVTNFNNEIQLVLDLRDERGKQIRVATIKDIKVKVWTQNPDCFLTFTYSDIQQRSHNDVIVIPQSRMLTLPTGVITYQYTYKVLTADPHHGHEPIKSKVVTTDIFWKNRHQNEVISNPSYYQSMEYLNDKIEHEKKERIKQYKDLAFYVTEEYANGLNDEITRAKVREGEIEAELISFSGDTETKLSDLKNKLDDEVKRSNQVDIEMFKYIKEVEEKVNSSNADNEEQKKETDNKIESTKEDLTKLIEEEVERAKKAEKELDNRIDENNSKFNLKDIELEATINAEITRAKLEEQRIEALVNSSIDTAKDNIKKLKKQVNNIVDSNSELTEKVNELVQKTNLEIQRATTEEQRIETKVNSNASNIESETNRAKVVEKDLADALQALKTLVQQVQGSVTDESIRSQLEDERINAVLEMLTGDKDVVGSVDHKIADSYHEVEHLIDELRDDLEGFLGESIGDYATKVYVDERFNHLVGTAPENLDTLEEIAQRLQRDDDLFKAIQELLSGKASKEDVYSKQEVDRKEADLQNAIQNEEQRATLVENGLQVKIDSLSGNTSSLIEKVNNHISNSDERYNELSNQLTQEVNRATNAEESITNSLNNLSTEVTNVTEKVNNHISEYETKYSELNNAIASEVSRATLAESQLQNSIEIINGNEEVVGSTDHKIADLKHELEDKISEIESNFVTDTLSDYARKEEVYNKNEIDSKEGTLNNAIQAEVQRATLVENGLTTQLEGVTSDLSALIDKVNNHISKEEESLTEVKKQISDEVNRATAKEEAINNSISNLNDDYTSFKEKVNQHIQSGDSYYQELNNALQQEVTRASNEETKLQSLIDIINGEENVAGSLKHYLEDSKHYTDDEIAKIKAESNESLKDYAKQSELVSLSDKVNNHISDSDNKYQEINNAIVAEITRATNAETINSNAIAIINGDEETIGSIKHCFEDSKHYTDDAISKLNLDNFATKDEVYLKQEIDEMFTWYEAD